jgi:hypothetical protein
VISSLSFATGSRLGFVAIMGNAAVAGGTVVPRRNNEVSVFMVLNMAASGSNLIADSRLVTYGSLRVRPEGSSALLPGPYAGLISPDGRGAYLLLVSARGVNVLARVSVATGKVTRVLVSTGKDSLSQPSDIDGSQMLVSLPPRRPIAPSGNYVCGSLGGINLATHEITRLPVSLYCSDVAPTPPFEAAW